MKSEVKYFHVWILPVLFVLLQKSGGKAASCVDMICGTKTSCALKKCAASVGATIHSVTIFGITSKCFSFKTLTWNFGRFNDYIWTTGCCVMRVHVCYGTPSQVNDDAVIVSKSTTVPAKTSNSSRKTVEDDGKTGVVSNSTTGTTSSLKSVSVSETITEQGSDDFEDNDFTMISTMTMVQASPFEMNLAQINQDGEGNTNIALKVALPVGIFVLVILLVVLGFVFRRKVKGLMGKLRGSRDNSPDLLNPMYGINDPALKHTGGNKFDNLTYAVQTGQENIQSGNIPTGVYDYAKKDGGQTNENKSKTVGDPSVSKYQPQYEDVGLKKPFELYDTAYQTLSGDASYDYIMGSNAEIMTSPHARLGETAYDNAAI